MKIVPSPYNKPCCKGCSYGELVALNSPWFKCTHPKYKEWDDVFMKYKIMNRFEYIGCTVGDNNYIFVNKGELNVNINIL